MSKRFIDTSIFRKGFVKGLEAPCKLFWVYLINECDHSGLWDVEIEIAEARLGVKFKGNLLEKFGGKIVEVDGGNKWFIPSFIEFQYGKLNPANRVHASVISNLKKYNLLTEDNQLSPLQGASDGAKDKDKDVDKVKEKEKDTEKEKESPNEFEETAQRVISYLNELADRKYLITNKLYLKHIIARLREGYSEDQLREIIEYKVAEWKGKEMERNLVPDTLFNNEKCNKYRDQVGDAKRKGLTIAQIRGDKKASPNANLMQEVQESLKRKFSAA